LPSPKRKELKAHLKLGLGDAKGKQSLCQAKKNQLKRFIKIYLK